MEKEAEVGEAERAREIDQDGMEHEPGVKAALPFSSSEPGCAVMWFLHSVVADPFRPFSTQIPYSLLDCAVGLCDMAASL
jgi:hypothetical protein